jgi:hypothetical protein
VQEIRRKTRRRFSAEEKIRIVLEGLRGKESIATLAPKRAWRRVEDLELYAFLTERGGIMTRCLPRTRPWLGPSRP